MTDKDADDAEDTFDQFKNIAVEQLANAAQLVAEARRLGLVPELPRELVEKMDLGGTLMDLMRLHLKHATAVSQVLGSNGRNMEKLNHMSAILAKGKSHPPKIIKGTQVFPSPRVFRFEITLDNPVDRPQKVELTLGTLYDMQSGDKFEVEPAHGVPLEKWTFKEKTALYRAVPDVERLEEREVRTFRIELGVPTPAEFEVTAMVKLSPLGTYNRYQLRIDAQASVPQ